MRDSNSAATEETYRLIAMDIVEQSPAVAFRVTGHAGRIPVLFITKNIAQYGYRYEDFMDGSLCWGDVVYPDDLPLLRGAERENDETQASRYSLQYRIVTANGDTIWVNDHTTVVRDEKGRPLHADTLISDYSQQQENRVRLEEHLRGQEALNDILQNLHDNDVEHAFDVILERAGRYLGISRALLFEDDAAHENGRLVHEWCNTGVPPFGEVGEFVLSYQRDIPQVMDTLEKTGHIVIGQGDVPATLALLLKAGNVATSAVYSVYLGEEPYGFLCFDVCGQPREWAAPTLQFVGTVAGLVSTAAMRKKNSAALRHTERVLSAVVNNLPAYVFATEPGSVRLQFANRAVQRDFGENMEDARLQDLVHEVTRQHALAALPGAAESGYFEIYLDGPGMWLGVSPSVIPWVDGRETCLYACQNITEKRQQEEYIHKMASTDHLTGLPNRFRCDIDLNVAVEEARVAGQSGALLFVDLDDFKVVNDAYGRNYGDTLLVAFSDYLRENFGAMCYVYRFGGDEFILLVAAEHAPRVQYILSSLLARGRKPWTLLGKTFYCTVSIGVVHFPGGDMSAKDVIQNAEIAMYEAKRLGKNNYAFYSGEQHNDSQKRAEMENMLRKCITRDFEGFEVFYQPVVGLADGRITGAEALLRWTSPDGQRRMPCDFIPLTEYLGLIVPLGDFVLRQACQLLRQINDNADPAFRMSVNVSIRQLQQMDIISRVAGIVHQSGIKPQNLVLEVTESMATTDLPRILEIYNTLRGMGVQIAMDDFGTGYSSLSNMRSMPLDVIKIDRSFVRDVGLDAYADSFIRLIADLGHTMGKQICVEGIETADQLAFCRTAGADTAQGFYLFTPVNTLQLLEEINAQN